ncbi:hypothetical protein E1178_09610, partial [Roseibium hamelinense]
MNRKQKKRIKLNEWDKLRIAGYYRIAIHERLTAELPKAFAEKGMVPTPEKRREIEEHRLKLDAAKNWLSESKSISERRRDLQRRIANGEPTFEQKQKLDALEDKASDLLNEFAVEIEDEDYLHLLELDRAGEDVDWELDEAFRDLFMRGKRYGKTARELDRTRFYRLTSNRADERAALQQVCERWKQERGFIITDRQVRASLLVEQAFLEGLDD